MSNFRAAWEWAVRHAEFALIEQTLRLLVWFYDTRGWFQGGLDTLGRGVDAVETPHSHSPSDRTDQIALGHLLTASSWLEYRLAHYDRAQVMLERSLELLRPLNEARVLVESLVYLGQVMEVTGNYARALELYSEGAEIGTAIGDRSYTAMCLVCLNGLIAITHVKEKPENTHGRLQSAVADCRAVGDPRLTGFGLRILSQSALALGQHDEARAALEESAALCKSVGDRWGFGSAYRGLGIIAQAQGKHQQAVVMFRTCLDTFTELGGSWWMARVLAEMGRSVFVLGDDAEAERVRRESLRIATEAGGTPVALEALVGIASVRAKRGEIEPALELLMLISNHPASLQETRKRAEQLRVELEALLTTSQGEAVRARVRATTLEDILDGVLKRADLA
jgi:tetratricopeptide (TPR) repeat protein